MTKRNSIFAEAIGNCGATFLRPDTTPLLCYRAAKEFVDEYERKEREQRHQRQACKPKVGEVYRDIFGNRYFVLAVHEILTNGTPLEKPFVVVVRIGSKGEPLLPDLYTPTLEDFMNPTFKKE